MVRGDSLALGYWRDQAKTSEAFRDGWYVSGDMISIDEQGSVTYAGRADDRLKVSGKWLSPKEARHLDRFVQFALAAAQEAVDNSNLDLSKENLWRVGCIWASGIGGLQEIERTHRIALERGPRKISPFFIPGIIINLASGQISILLGAKGPNISTVTASAEPPNGGS